MVRLRCLVVCLLVWFAGVAKTASNNDAVTAYDTAFKLLQGGQPQLAAPLFWRAMTHGHPDTVACYQHFVKCYAQRGIPEEAHLELARAFVRQKQFDSARTQLLLALQHNPTYADAFALLVTIDDVDDSEGGSLKGDDQVKTHLRIQQLMNVIELSNGTCVECMVKLGSLFFNLGLFENATAVFERCASAIDIETYADCSFLARDRKNVLRVQCLSTLVYLKTTIVNWRKLPEMMGALESALQCPCCQSIAIVQPHMTLHYDMNPSVKVQIAKATASAIQQRVQENAGTSISFDAQSMHRQFSEDTTAPQRIRVGLISADFRLKATAYLVYDLYVDLWAPLID